VCKKVDERDLWSIWSGVEECRLERLFPWSFENVVSLNFQILRSFYFLKVFFFVEIWKFLYDLDVVEFSWVLLLRRGIEALRIL
jgi:hypothetical protein